MIRIAVICLTLLVSGAAYSDNPAPSPAKSVQQQKTNTAKSNKSANTDKRGTKELPLVIDIIPAENADEIARQNQEHHHEQAFNERLIAWGTVALVVVTFLLFLVTAFLWNATVNLGRDAKATGDRQATEMKESLINAEKSANAIEHVANAMRQNYALMKETADRQAADMQKSIATATQSANGIEQVAISTRENAALIESMYRKQMRAYLSVDIGGATYQDEKLRFASAPVLTNTGYTPAKNVSFKVMTDIFNTNMPDNFKFPDIVETKINDAALAPRQQVVIHGVVKDRVPDDQVGIIMFGAEKRLFIWGTVTYQDIFGDSWVTNFCHNFEFIRIGDEIKPYGYYHRTNNSAT